jgi:16S rRNA (guanine1516-N2)-methyltransferase
MPDDPSRRRADLIVTTPLKTRPPHRERAGRLADELNATLAPRQHAALPELFAQYPEATRCLIVQSERLLLVDRAGHEFFYHPNMAFLRLHNVLKGFRDVLIEAADLRPGDRVLDATLGYAAEAILCAHIVGDGGEVHGIESVPELGILAREGLANLVTENNTLNAAMRRVRVVHLGHHLEYLRSCRDARYDVVCFDPFFGVELPGSEQFAPIRYFGDHARLLPEAVREARRVARRRVVIKCTRWSEMLAEYGATERFESRNGKVKYGVLRADAGENGAENAE